MTKGTYTILVCSFTIHELIFLISKNDFMNDVYRIYKKYQSTPCTKFAIWALLRKMFPTRTGKHWWNLDWMTSVGIWKRIKIYAHECNFHGNLKKNLLKVKLKHGALERFPRSNSMSPLYYLLKTVSFKSGIFFS